ncbi:hypothetical protein [Mariniblastus fucicola]|uniref:Uncharacterized protein n=1 Tax=Mariniblastus fucicola TaxID=980251 RepID=A0A5B9PQ74_9BACT|nr:hypothetical protein [Mariniblastus fucicola]QEG24453.1 hypothetical protein MFFC18_43730 [Mariniblastus fucicola]
MIDPQTLQQFQASAENGIDEALEFLHQQFLNSGQFHRLFDVLKMKARRSLGLRLLHSESDPALGEKDQEKLETKLLEACRTVAKLYFAEGNLNDGWVYLQPLGDEPLAKELIEGVAVTEDNFGSIIEVAFNNGVSPLHGYRLMLEKTGTCNGITAFDVHATQFDRQTISGLASVLLNHFHDEILANVIDHVARIEKDVDRSATLEELLQQHQWLVREGGHHADATHLASIIRIARQTTTVEDHRLALSLANYGCRLGEDFKFSSDPPFEDLYVDHRIWFEALSGLNVDQAIEHFTAKADSCKGEFHEMSAAEALVDLQIRTGDRDSAVESVVQRLLGQTDQDNLPASAFEIARTPSQYEKIAAVFRDQGNFAGLAFAKLCGAESESE